MDTARGGRPGQGRPPPPRRSLKEEPALSYHDEPAAADVHPDHGHWARVRNELLSAIQGQHALLRYELLRAAQDVSEEGSAVDTVLNVSPQSQNPERITLVVAYVGTGLGLLELGNTDPIPLNSTVWQPFVLPGRWTLEATDRRTLSSITFAAGGIPNGRGSGATTYLYLALFGEEIPRGELSF